MLPLALALTVVAALPADYALGSSDWNGLGRLARRAEELGCPIEARDPLAWDELTGTDVLWILYPRTPIAPEPLARFLDAGGRVVLGDDFGAADGAFARLGLERRAGGARAARLFQDNPHLPEADASGASPLARAATAIVTNHPASFRTRWPAAYAFSPDAAAVVEGRLGRGRFIALADPSVLINNMQEIPEDRRFAEALLLATCRPHRDRVILVGGTFDQRGEPPAVLAGAPDEGRPEGDGAREAWNGGLADLNAALGKLGASPPTDGAPFVALALAGVALAALAWARGLPPRLASHDGAWTRAPSSAARSQALDDGLALSLLREEAALRVAGAIGAPASTLSPAAIEARLGGAAGRAGAALWRALAERPTIERAHRLARELFDLLDERRT